MADPLRMMVVDDSALFRKVMADTLQGIPGVEVVARASNGDLALKKIDSIHPDVITLDVEMPVMNGIETLQQLRQNYPNVDCLMVSAVTTEGADTTLKALELGAIDFITKPHGASTEDNAAELLQQIRPLLSGIRQRKNRSRDSVNLEQLKRISQHVAPQGEPAESPDIVAIGVSTGGPKALATLLPTLPENFRVPIVVVQHMPALFTKQLAQSLNLKTKLEVVEAVDKQQLKPGVVYIAPGGQHMKLTSHLKGSGIIRITDDPPEKHCKPSVDYMFRSVAKVFAGRALGVILTGMGDDGVIGLRLMKRHNAQVIAQDEATCTVFGMPQGAIKAGVVDVVAPLEQIADEIIRQVGRAG